jgi:hypothetical protein
LPFVADGKKHKPDQILKNLKWERIFFRQPKPAHHPKKPMPVCNAKETKEEAEARGRLQSIYLLDIYLYSNASDKLNPGHDNRAFEAEASTWNPEHRKEAEALFEYGMSRRDADAKAEERLTKEMARADKAERKAKEMEVRLAKAEKAVAAAEERLATVETERAVLVAKVQGGGVDAEQPGTSEEGAPDKKRKRSSKSGGKAELKEAVKRFVTDCIVAADKNTFVSTKEILCAFERNGHVVDMLEKFAIELSKQVRQIHPTGMSDRKEYARGYRGIALKSVQ